MSLPMKFQFRFNSDLISLFALHFFTPHQNTVLTHLKKPIQRFQENRKTVAFLFTLSVTFLVIGFYCIFKMMAVIEEREGVVLNDFLHPLLPLPIDLSPWIFAATYSASVLIIVHVLRRGLYFATVVFLAYSFLFLLRSSCIFFVPLDPPPGMIALDDPFIRFFNPDNFVYTKDLFFSGHTASMVSFYLLANEKRLKTFLFFIALFVMAAISIQRVHYTIDILGGIMAAYLTYALVHFLEKKLWHLCHSPVPQKLAAVKSVAPVLRKEKMENARP